VISLRRAAGRPPTRPALPPGGVPIPGDRSEAPRPVAFPRGVGVVTRVRPLCGLSVLRRPETAPVRSVRPEGHVLAPALAARPGQTIDRAVGSAFPVASLRRSDGWFRVLAFPSSRSVDVLCEAAARLRCSLSGRPLKPLTSRPEGAVGGWLATSLPRRAGVGVLCQGCPPGRQHLQLLGFASPRRRSAHLSSSSG